MAKSILDSLPTILLMGPGPSCVPPEVYSALSRPTIGHMDSVFIAIMNEIKILLQQLLNTQNRLTIPMSGTGSSGMETSFVNLVERDDPVLILINGVFGMRMKDVATRLGAQVDALEFEWGTPVLLPAIEQALSKKKYSMVAVVHAETSTGVRNPIKEISPLVVKNGALYLVDTVTSLGGIEVRMDDWHIDVLYSGTQKCLSCPPGLSPVSFSERAIDKLTRRKSAVPNWYLDLSMIMKYWEGNTRVYHHTAPVNMLYGLHAALSVILAQGTDTVFARHLENHLKLVKGLADLGLEMLVKEPFRLPMLNAVKIPEGVNDAAVRNELRAKYEIEIGGGLGPLAGKVWRIGLMGHTARKENVDRLLASLKTILNRH